MSHMTALTSRGKCKILVTFKQSSALIALVHVYTMQLIDKRGSDWLSRRHEEAVFYHPPLIG